MKKEFALLSSERASVEIHLPDGQIITGPRGSTVIEFLNESSYKGPTLMGAIVNGELRELTYPISMEANVVPLMLSDNDGARIYRRSLTFILEAAFESLFPERMLSVDHSVTSGGFYCHVDEGAGLTEAEIQTLETEMRKLVKQDIPFERNQVPLQEAVEYFRQRGHMDKVRLLKYRTKDYLILYNLGEYKDYFHGYMLPSTGYLKWFDLIPADDGFILHFTKRMKPTELQPLGYSPRLLATFRQYGNWLSKLGIEFAGTLNEAILSGKIREVILVSEALHEQRISDIATRLLNQSPQPKIVLIAGPSSSGKTTFSKRLSIQLLTHGIEPFPFEMDNYFVDRELTPKNKQGEYDFESMRAMNTDLMADHLKRLINMEEVELRRYDFQTGKNLPGAVVRLPKDSIIIVEGIHGLNPNLLTNIDQSMAYRVYASCLTQLNLDRYNRVSTTDTRLLRRTIRDQRERGYSAQQTIQRWNLVRKGESEHIFPYQDNADDIFNSALVYELSALRPIAEPILRQVPAGTMEHIEAKRLLSMLEWFMPLDAEMIPDNSLLREFIGHSILKDFTVWKAD